jgi:3-oxoadipate enol-lactonase
VSGALYVEDVGAGLPVLAIHGLGGGAHFFGGLARRLQSADSSRLDDLQIACRVISVDLPGTGRSASAESFTMESWVRDLGARVAGDIREPVLVLGHSMGTMLALHAWRMWPDLVRGLIFVGGLPRVRPLVHDRLRERLDALADAEDLTGWGPKVSPANFSPVTMRQQPEVVALFERLFESQPIEQYRQSLRILLDSDVRGVAATIAVPVLAIAGADDQYAPPDAVAEFVRAIPAPCRLEVMDRCGHLPFLEQPEAFAGVVKSFLRTC